MDNYNNYENVINSNFYDLYEEIKNEIREKVLTKLLLIVQNQHKELLLLRKENTSLKNHLTYILKRILLQKNDYNNNNKTIYNGSLTSIKKSFMYNNSSIDKYRHKSFKPQKRHKLAKNLNDSNDFNEQNTINNTNNSIINQKIKRYLNTIYRNNFMNSNNSGLNNLNKNDSLYIELFNSNRKNYKTINERDNSINNKYNNTITITDGDMNKSDIDKSIYIIRNFKTSSNKKSKIKNYQEEQIKDVFFDDDNEYNYNYCVTENNFYSRNKGNRSKRLNYGRNTKNNYGEKIKAKKDLLYKRSPFLINKY